jgi:hypothetical protein
MNLAVELSNERAFCSLLPDEKRQFSDFCFIDPKWYGSLDIH